MGNLLTTGWVQLPKEYWPLSRAFIGQIRYRFEYQPTVHVPYPPAILTGTVLSGFTAMPEVSLNVAGESVESRPSDALGALIFNSDDQLVSIFWFHENQGYTVEPFKNYHPLGSKVAKQSYSKGLMTFYWVLGIVLVPCTFGGSIALPLVMMNKSRNRTAVVPTSAADQRPLGQVLPNVHWVLADQLKRAMSSPAKDDTL